MAQLSTGTLILAAVIMAVTEILLLRSTWRSSTPAAAEADARSAPQPRPVVETLWTLLPAAFLLVLLLAGVGSLPR